MLPLSITQSNFYTLDLLQDEVEDWANEAFPQSTLSSILSHLKEEIEEFLDEPSAEEAADIVMLIMHYASKEQFSLEEAIRDKFEINKKRIWSSIPTEGGHFKHV